MSRLPLVAHCVWFVTFTRRKPPKLLVADFACDYAGNTGMTRPKSVRNIPPLSPTLKQSIAEHNQRVTEVIRSNQAKVASAAPPPKSDLPTTTRLTDPETEANPRLNELLEKGRAEFPINGYIVHLDRGKETAPYTKRYFLSVNGIELPTPLIFYLNTGYFMFDIPDNLRRGTPGVIWERSLHDALHRVIADPWVEPWFEEVVTATAAKLLRFRSAVGESRMKVWNYIKNQSWGKCVFTELTLVYCCGLLERIVPQSTSASAFKMRL
jgi:hypothetical protein